MTDDDQWTKLYRYLDKRFKAVDERFEQMDQTLQEYLALIAGLATRADHDDIECAAMAAQLDRLEVAINH